MPVVRRTVGGWLLGFALASHAASCGSSTHHIDPDAAATSDAGSPDARVEVDTGNDSGGSDASVDGAVDPDEDGGPVEEAHPCDSFNDCLRWWEEDAYCLNGTCCAGFEVAGRCECGSIHRSCGAGETCCHTQASPESFECAPPDSCVS